MGQINVVGRDMKPARFEWRKGMMTTEVEDGKRDDGVTKTIGERNGSTTTARR